MPVSYFFVVVPNIKVMFCCLAIDKGFFTHYSVLMESVFTNRWSIGEKAIIWVLITMGCMKFSVVSTVDGFKLCIIYTKFVDLLRQ